MNHIKFASTTEPVCENPKLLGHDFVVINYNEGPSCNECLALMLNFNQRSRKYDLLVDLPQKVPYYTVEENLARGMVYGFLFSIPFWIGVLITTYFIFFR